MIRFVLFVAFFPLSLLFVNRDTAALFVAVLLAIVIFSLGIGFFSP